MRRILAAITLLAFAGCGAAPKKGEDLMESVMTYNEGVRWDRLTAAASRVPPAEREDFVDERDELAEDLEITDWEVKRVTDKGSDAAFVHVKYTWYKSDEGIVHETHAKQSWERKGKAWLIVDERRTRGEEMPGLAEGEEEDEEAEEVAEGAEGATPAEPR
jgi:hypothetical protein